MPDELKGFVIILVVVIVGLMSLYFGFSLVDSANDPEVGIDVGVEIVCSENYAVGFWFITKGSLSYYKAEKMTETEYAMYCVK